MAQKINTTTPLHEAFEAAEHAIRYNSRGQFEQAMEFLIGAIHKGGAYGDNATQYVARLMGKKWPSGK